MNQIDRLSTITYTGGNTVLGLSDTAGAVPGINQTITLTAYRKPSALAAQYGVSLDRIPRPAISDYNDAFPGEELLTRFQTACTAGDFGSAFLMLKQAHVAATVDDVLEDDRDAAKRAASGISRVDRQHLRDNGSSAWF